MKNQCTLFLLSFFCLFLSTALMGQNSLPIDANPFIEYTQEQKTEINSLLINTKGNLVTRLRKSKDDEYISKVLVTSSYKFAKGYSSIMNDDSVPFKLITSSTSFLGCWASENFETTEKCWDTHLYKVNGANYASLKN